MIRPRLTDHFGIHKAQSELDFAIQLLNEDIPLYVDPFLLWKSPSLQDQALHSSIVNSFNHFNYLRARGATDSARDTLVAMSECGEVGLGVSKSRSGVRISTRQANEILTLFESVPEYEKHGFKHFEVIQLYVDGIGKDRISDFTCNFLKSFLIDYTIDQCDQLGIPMQKVTLDQVYDYRSNTLKHAVDAVLPVNPKSGLPLIFTPKRWLRYTPWIAFEDYFKAHCPRDEIFNPGEPEERVRILQFNRENYGVVEGYIAAKIRTAEDCKNDPLFTQIPILSAKRKLTELLKLPTGKEDGADWKYEDLCGSLFTSLLYPELDFAAEQSRTDSGRHIRDLVFYNNRSIDFLDEIFAKFGSHQLVFEMKNVEEVTRDHVNQLNRYLNENLGHFGVLVTRNELKKSIFQNTIDLWSAQRRCIIALTDEDLKMMCNVYESKQRSPLDVIKKRYIEFTRSCPT